MKKLNPQSGQTLIETITAIFILTMALVSGLSLAIYSSQNSQYYENEIVATNLAREGIEVVRMFRDTNWLAAEDEASVQDLYITGGGCDFPVANNGNGSVKHPCYPEAFTEPNTLANTGSDNHYRVNFFADEDTDWRPLEPINGKENYFLCLQPDGMYRHNDPGNSGITCTDPLVARFARRVTITQGNTSFPYTVGVANPGPTGNRAQSFGGHSPEKIVTSYVVWQGKNCTEFPTTSAALNAFDPATFATKCKITIQERITNWKDYR